MFIFSVYSIFSWRKTADTPRMNRSQSFASCFSGPIDGFSSSDKVYPSLYKRLRTSTPIGLKSTT